MGLDRSATVTPFPRSSYHVLRWLTVFLLFVVGRGERQSQLLNGVGRSFRAPKTCSPRPDYCNNDRVQQEPWTCKQEVCSLRKIENVIPTISKAANLAANPPTASVHFYNSSEGCHQALNITWTTTISDDTAGFLLLVTRHGPTKGVFNRTTQFVCWINGTKCARDRERENELATFYSDCLRLAIASSYRFRLFSLHSVPGSEEIASHSIGETSIVTDCDTYPEADPAFLKWPGYTTVVFPESNSTANVYFTPAPRSFGFTSYKLSILDSGSTETLASTSNLTFTCTNIGVVVVRNICSGNYTVKINAFGGPCPCNSCSSCSRRQPFVVQGSNHRCPSEMIIEVPSHGTSVLSSSSAASSVQESKSANHPHVIGPVIAICVIVVFATIVGIFIFMKMRRRKHDSHIKGVVTEANDSDDNVAVEKSLEKQTVLLVYAKDNAHHCDVVRCFAAYLHRRCYCTVKFDVWYADEIGETSALDWLLRNVQTVDTVVVVNSESGWRQYEADSRDSTGFQRIRRPGCDGSAVGPIEDVFLAALKELRSGYYCVRRREQHRVFKVAFPYTRPDHCVDDIHPGRTYRLMDHVEDLFLNVHGLSRHSRNGRTTTAVGINGRDYVGCPEGRRLRASIARAIEYFRAAPNWFSASYRQKTQPRSSSPTSSSESRKNFTRSDLEFDLEFDLESRTGTLFVPPPSLLFVPPFVDSGTVSDDDYDSASVLSVKLATTIELLNKDYDRTIDPQ